MSATLAAVLLQLGSATPAALPLGDPPVRVTNPGWTRRPTINDLLRHYPQAARRENLAGRASIRCQVLATGTLSGCELVSEEPQGAGFGQGALNMSTLFKMRPQTRDGKPVDGGTVRIPIRFAGPPDVRIGAFTVREAAFKGASLELNCRYLDGRLDNCLLWNGASAGVAADAAVRAAEQLVIAKLPRSAGRLSITVQFAE